LFSKESEIIGKTIIAQLAEINTKYGSFITNKFNATFNCVSNPETGIENYNGKFDESFFSSKIQKNFEKIYICGPPKFNKDIYNGLIESKAEETKIFLL